MNIRQQHRHQQQALKFVLAGLMLAFTGLLLTLPVAAAPSHQDAYPPPNVGSDPYPSPHDSSITADTVLPGSLNSAAISPLSTQQDSPDSGNGLPILWLGFIATFLLFIAAIIGTMLLFTRPNNP